MLEAFSVISLLCSLWRTLFLMTVVMSLRCVGVENRSSETQSHFPSIGDWTEYIKLQSVLVELSLCRTL